MLMLAVAALLLSAPVAPPPDAAGVRPQLLVVMRQETQPPLTGEVLRRIAAEATEIWRPYLDIAFQSADNLQPFRGDDSLNLVLTDRQSNGRIAAGLGWIDFVEDEPSRTITVSVGAAKALAAEGRWGGRRFDRWPPSLRQTFLTRALARGVAHEIGHYLLRSKSHAAGGLMRATFTIDEIMTAGLRAYRLQSDEIELLNQRTTTYALARRRSADPVPQ